MADETENTVVNGRNPDGTFAKGNPGKPKGALSFKARIRQIFKDEPEIFEQLARDYIKDPKYRELLWKMLEGQPRQSHEVEGKLDVILTQDQLDELLLNYRETKEDLSEG